MSQQDQATPSGRPNGLQYSFATNGSGHSFTWSPPVSESQNKLAHGQPPHAKRRRVNEVEVNLERHGVARIRLGEDATFDFTSYHEEAEKKILGLESERDTLLRRLEEANTSHEEALSDVIAKQDDRVARTIAGSLIDKQAAMEELHQQLNEANSDYYKIEQELRITREKLSCAAHMAASLELIHAGMTATELRCQIADDAEKIKMIEEKLQSSEDNGRAVLDIVRLREREIETCRKEMAGMVNKLRTSDGEIASLRGEVSELKDALKKHKKDTIIGL